MSEPHQPVSELFSIADFNSSRAIKAFHELTEIDEKLDRIFDYEIACIKDRVALHASGVRLKKHKQYLGKLVSRRSVVRAIQRNAMAAWARTLGEIESIFAAEESAGEDWKQGNATNDE